MFTDELATPTRLETMIDLLRTLRGQQRHVDADMLHNLLQPDGLPDLNTQRGQSKKVLQAAKELGLVAVDDAGRLSMAAADRAGRRPTRDWVIEAFDAKVLSDAQQDAQVEPYFAKFYAYMLIHGSSDHGRSKDEWVRDFKRDVFNDEQMPNPFNKEKITGMHRWMPWAGLGWYDAANTFHCNPYARVRRRLASIFEKYDSLEDEAFIGALGRECPELDGGAVFTEVARQRDGADHSLTLGLAQALLELHEDKVIRLDGSQDADGWALDRASPTGLAGDRLHAVALLRRD